MMYENVEVGVRLKANNGIVDQGAGLSWRAKNGGTYYVARVQSTGGHVPGLQGDRRQAISSSAA
ncbi:MAG: hypothetical protein U0992_00090 [Planctomycetaceae bacterium]